MTACRARYLQMADWLYAGPSVALRACPTWVCVRPRDRRRILKALANSRISSRLTPSTSPDAVWGSVEMFLKQDQHVNTQPVSMFITEQPQSDGDTITVPVFVSHPSVHIPPSQAILQWPSIPDKATPIYPVTSQSKSTLLWGLAAAAASKGRLLLEGPGRTL